MSGIFAAVEEAVEELRAGRMVIVTDDEDRENEGDFVMASEAVTPEAVNFMTVFGRGLVCQSITLERARELALAPMVADNTSVHTTAFTVSVDARGVTTTGISAFDRAATIKTIIDPASGPDSLLRPGHIFPLIAKDGGVLERDGHTEASLELARLAGFRPSGVLCEILAGDGTMARLPRLREIAREHNLKIVTVAALIRYLKERAGGVTRITEGRLPSASGDFRLILYENPRNAGQPHIAMVSLKEFDRSLALVRVHSECLTGEVLMSARCDCGAQLSESLRRTGEEGGVVIYLRQEGRGIGLAEKIRAYNLQDEGCDTVDANIKLGHEPDERDYGVAAEILRDLGITGIRLMTNNPDKEHALKGAGIEVRERVPIEIKPGEKNRAYLATKKVRLGHDLKYV